MKQLYLSVAHAAPIVSHKQPLRQCRKLLILALDNGPGLSPGPKEIFLRFHQANRSLSRRAEGCGLGLGIAKFIVDARQGAISVESKTNQGSTFTRSSRRFRTKATASNIVFIRHVPVRARLTLRLKEHSHPRAYDTLVGASSGNAGGN
jgi:hypothetical protein